MLRDATQQSFFEVLEENDIPYTFCKSEGVLKFTETGSRILFRSMDEFERLRGTNIAWFGLDELTYTHEDAWLRLEGRLRDAKATQLTGFAVWTPRGYDWVYRRFVERGTTGYQLIRAKAFENTHILDTIPDYYERLMSSYDEAFYKQEVLGEYLNTRSQRVYSAFDYAEHVKPLTPDKRLPICWALDFNVDPLCSVIAQIDGDRVSVLDEIVLSRAMTQEACDEFSKRYGGHAAGYEIFGDASGQARSTRGNTDYEIITAHFKARRERMRYVVPRANPRVIDRTGYVNSKLRTADGERRMTIDPKCKELIKDFEQVAYLESGSQIDKDKDRRRTHSSDALGYLVYAMQKPAVAFGPQQHRLL